MSNFIVTEIIWLARPHLEDGFVLKVVAALPPISVNLDGCGIDIPLKLIKCNIAMALKLPSKYHKQLCVHLGIWYIVYVLLTRFFWIQGKCGISNSVVAEAEHLMEDVDYVEKEEHPYIYRAKPTDNRFMLRATIVQI